MKEVFNRQTNGITLAQIIISLDFQIGNHKVKFAFKVTVSDFGD